MSTCYAPGVLHQDGRGEVVLLLGPLLNGDHLRDRDDLHRDSPLSHEGCYQRQNRSIRMPGCALRMEPL